MQTTIRTEHAAHSALRATLETPRPAWQAPAPARHVAAARSMRAHQSARGAVRGLLTLGAVVVVALLAGCGGGDYCEAPEPADVHRCAEARAQVPAQPIMGGRI